MIARSRWAFLTFGAGLPNWRAAARRLQAEAKSSGWFDTSLALNERDLGRLFPNFVDEHRRLLTLRVRGFGYWIWKSFLILEMTNQLSRDYAGIVYLDSGCQLNPVGQPAQRRMSEYLDLANDQGLFAVHLPHHPEEEWSRQITMDYLGLSPTQRKSPQVQGGIVAVTRKSIEIIHEWYETSRLENYRYLSDELIGELNAPGFKAHRHDQSIFSAIVKKHGKWTIPDETFWAPDWIRAGADYPIWAPRNRTRVPIQATDLSSRTIALWEKAYSRGLMEGLRYVRLRSGR